MALVVSGMEQDEKERQRRQRMRSLAIALALAALVALFYAATYSGFIAPRGTATLAVLAAFVLPSALAFLRTTLVRRRRRRPDA